jgi:hypothetical protein
MEAQDLAATTEPDELAFIGNAILAVGNGESPETFTPYCAVSDISGISEKNDQVDVTTFCNGGSKHYVPGLSDGAVMTFKANFAVAASESKTVQDDLIQAVKAKINRNFEVQMGVDSPFALFSFTAAMLSWEVTPSITKQNEVTFTAKISGPVAYT